MVNQEEARKSEKGFYDSFWQSQQALSCDEKCRMRFILSELNRLRGPGLKIADVGCGRGWLTELVSHFGDATGFDLSTVEARKRYPARHFVECDILDLPTDSFDVAVCSEVIEHVRSEEQPRLVESLFSILRHGGTLILTTPNKPKVSSLVDQLSLQHELQPVEDWLDVEGLSKLVSRRFEIEKLRTVMFFPVALRKIGPVSRIYRWIYQERGAYRIVDPLLGRTGCGLYIALVGKRTSTQEPTVLARRAIAEGGKLP